MNRRSFMQSAFVDGIISTIGTKSSGETIVKEKENIKKKERTNIIDYLDNGGRLCLGMYIAECSKRSPFFPSRCYRIIGMGDYQIGLDNVALLGTNGVKSKIKSASNISKKEICSLIEKYYKKLCREKITINSYEGWIIMEPEDVIEMMISYEKTLKRIYS